VSEERSEDRLGLAAPAGSTYRFPIDSPAAELRFGIAVRGVDKEVSAIIEIRLESESGESEVLFSEQISSDTPWSERTVVLAEQSGPSDLVLTSRPLPREQPDDEPSEAWVFWASPEVVFAPFPSAPRADDEPFDLLLISIDTLRADHLGSYGYALSTSPYLDSIADSGWRFDQALSHSPWTRPSHRAILTGNYPLSHPESPGTFLAEMLWRAGYRTTAWTGGGQMDFAMGFDRGFETFHVDDWLRDRESWTRLHTAEPNLEPRFLFLHTYEVHDPYSDDRFARSLPSGRIDGYFNQSVSRSFQGDLTDAEKTYVEALYDGGIAYADEQLEAAFETIERDWNPETTLLVITSDHGEEFWDHGSWRHGQSVYQHQLRVPLLLRIPPALREHHGIAESGVIGETVRQVDLVPTLLELLGLSAPAPMQGRSLVPLLRGETLPPVPSLAEDIGPPGRESKSLQFDGMKVIRTESFAPDSTPAATRPESVRVEFYDVRDDPSEAHDLSSEEGQSAEALLRRLAELSRGKWTEAQSRGTRAAPEEGETLDPRLQERLEALGYLD